MPGMEQTLADLARHVGGRVIGDGSVAIRGLNNLDEVRSGELTFAIDARRVAQALQSQASAIIVGPDIQDLKGKSGISVANPKLAFALALELFYPAATPSAGVHTTAVIGRDVHLGKNVSIRAHAVIGDSVSVGDGTVVESGVHIGDRSSIGDRCFIAPNVVIYRDTIIGHRVRIHGGTVIGGDGFGYVVHEGRHIKVPQVGNVVIEDDVELGCNVCVDRATIGSTIIRRGTKIDNLVQIAHNDRIGEHVSISGQTGFSGSVTVGNHAIFGGQAGVADHVHIGEHAHIGGASVVTKSVPARETVWGYPARPIREAKEQLAILSRLPALLAALTAGKKPKSGPPPARPK
jgi:UDP-3-O-[3-hydroxymyristoyl] glucosamine N-acyltransferase